MMTKKKVSVEDVRRIIFQWIFWIIFSNIEKLRTVVELNKWIRLILVGKRERF